MTKMVCLLGLGDPEKDGSRAICYGIEVCSFMAVICTAHVAPPPVGKGHVHHHHHASIQEDCVIRFMKWPLDCMKAMRTTRNHFSNRLTCVRL